MTPTTKILKTMLKENSDKCVEQRYGCFFKRTCTQKHNIIHNLEIWPKDSWDQLHPVVPHEV